MMELLVAILMSIGSLTTTGDFNDEYKRSHQAEISKAQSIIDSGQFVKDDTGGVTVDPGVGI
jgi:hypothetical protein